MKITVLATLLMMAAYFLVLYGAVGFIQDKRFFGSAPKENLAAIPDKKERFRGAHGIGWGLKPSPYCIGRKPLLQVVHTVIVIL